jgi:hypothetical protein
VLLTKKFRKCGHHDIPKNFYKYNDKEHQNSKYFIFQYGLKFYKTWAMYSRKEFNENISLSVYIFSNLMGLIKFSMTFLVGPPSHTSNLWSNNICSIVITDYNKYATKTSKKHYFEIVKIHLIIMVNTNHNQRKCLGKHEYKNSYTTFARNWLWSTSTIARKSLQTSLMINIHGLLSQEIGYD